jgi:PPP family 3-phenylpropionic acid transporter
MPKALTGFAPRLAAFYAALFAALGVQLPFLPVWFAAKGLDAQTIGLALAVPMVVRVFAIPMATRAADRRDALRATLVITALLAVAGYGALALSHGPLAIVAVYACAAAAYGAMMLLADAYALRGLAARGRAYGPVRLWGSVAFMAASLAAGALLDVIPATQLIWLVFAAMVLAAGAACTLLPLGRHPEAAAEPRSGTRLLRQPAFIAVLAAASLIQGSHAVYYGFATLAWQVDGLGGGLIGTLWALGVLAEIAMFAVSARLPAMAPTLLLVLGAAGAVVRWTAMAFGPPPAALPVLQCLHALSFAATHLGALGFIVRTVPVRLGATAQGYLAIALGLAMAGGMALSGVLYGSYGSLAYVAMAGAALLGGGCALGAHRLWRGDPRR